MKFKKYEAKAERLSREYTKLRDVTCVCGCGKNYDLDWAHGISREREQFKYHPNNTMRLNHFCHLGIDHSPIKHALMDALMSSRLGADVWAVMKLQSFAPFKPTVIFYENQIEELQQLIAGLR